MNYKMNNNEPQDLESRMHRVLRGLPDRKAPSGLEARVLAELGRRAALPWWRKSFAHWPSAVRISFFAFSALAATALAVGAFVLGHSPLAHAVAGGVSNGFGWFVMARDIAVAAGDKVRMLVASVPPFWLYGASALVAVSFACVAALGAATFRALSVARQNP